MLISRRTAIVRGATVLTGLFWVGSANAAPAAATYQLKTWRHCSCKACHHHAANRLFATRAAADHGRAHRGCKCTVVRTSSLNAGQWQALFGPGHKPHRVTADRRWASTKRALQHVAKSRKPTKKIHRHH